MVTVGLIEGAAEATALIVKAFSGAVRGCGLRVLSKPLLALATTTGWLVTARCSGWR